jgi:hypothetical protein
MRPSSLSSLPEDSGTASVTPNGFDAKGFDGGQSGVAIADT